VDATGLPGPTKANPEHDLRNWNLGTVAVFFTDSTNGWRVDGLSGEIERTVDAGKSWTKRSVLPDVHDIHMSSGGLVGWAVGKAGAILGTRDGGSTWYPQTATVQPQLTDLWLAPDGRNAWAVGEDGMIAVSVDGGHTWLQQSSGVTGTLFAVVFLEDALRGWAAGERGSIIVTTDGGKRWTTPASTNELRSYYSLSFSPDGLQGWAIDDKGNKVVTSNGGVSWELPERNANRTILHSVGFSPDRKLGWAVDAEPNQLRFTAGRRLLNSTDGGNSWTETKRLSGKKFVSVSFGASGVLGCALIEEPTGNPGWQTFGNGRVTVMTTENAGTTWQPSTSPIARGLNAVKLLSDGIHGVAVGVHGIILATDDGGKSWRYAEQYGRSPAPWYWVAVAITLILVWAAWHLRPAQANRMSVANVAASDAEVRRPADDRLNFAGLARGISRFLRNTETQPPLTLAITGDWGSGKSSLMQLVCADLRRFHHRPIWFNAWHHQKEEHLFAALLGAIYAQAAPPLFSISGLGFRLKLLRLRSWRHFGILLLTVTIVAGLTIFSLRALQSGGFKNITVSVNALRDRVTPSVGALSGLLAALTALLALVKGSTPFAINPALLLGTARAHMSLKAAAAQNDFRHQFARQFEELTNALPYRLVIVIDDLDRCRPPAVIEVMEAVNYLTSAGKCFVIFGMASERVIAALGLAFKDIAAELVQMEYTTEMTAAADPSRELTKRRAYATDYLQKLVNIEIKVPFAKDQPHSRLLLRPESAPRRNVGSFLVELIKLWPLVAVVLALLFGAGVAGWSENLLQDKASTPPLANPSQLAPPILKQPAVATAPTRTPGSGELATKRDSPFEVRAGDATNATAYAAWIGGAFLPVLATIVLIGTLQLAQNLYRTKDSTEFQEALEIWTPVVASKRATPRAIKRFGNRLRYLAMLQQGEENDLTVFDLLRAKIKQWRHSGSGPSPSILPGPDALSEQQLIALGTMFEVFGENWKERMSATFPPGWRDTWAQAGTPGWNRIVIAAATHQDKFDTDWPPSPAEIAVFERLIAGVRLAGDPRTLVPSRTKGA
jgi:photosystem II stability/assembly factor-like uncharacterized protein